MTACPDLFQRLLQLQQGRWFALDGQAVQIGCCRQLLSQVWDSSPDYQDPATVTVHAVWTGDRWAWYLPSSSIPAFRADLVGRDRFQFGAERGVQDAHVVFGGRAAGLAGILRVVVFAPEDMLLISGGPALRRTAKIGDAWYPIPNNPAFPMDSLKRLTAGIEAAGIGFDDRRLAN